MPNRVRHGDGALRRCLRFMVLLALLTLLHTELAAGLSGLTPAGAADRAGCPGVAAASGPEAGPTATGPRGPESRPPAIEAAGPGPRLGSVATASDAGCIAASRTVSVDVHVHAGLGCHQDSGLPGPRDGSAARRPVTGAGHPAPAPGGPAFTVHAADRADDDARTQASGAAVRCPSPTASVSRLRC